ncbi:hypothetical protein PoB_001258200 [Plakobranchus ocellatus]|uniref:Uncharacterized protein n=1 Tax=Plakobranchus ocellatus TaxID=259542 RepID=A0AAV3YVB0_9GAST|nr:hypothetical protein PoB_001258200 [Plakobranchus ocellatus]
MIKSFSALNSSSILPRPSRRESPHAGECALKSPSTRKSSARESFETGESGGRYREQTVRVFSRLIVAAAACRPVFKSISMLVSDSHYCRAVNLNLQDPPLPPYGSHLAANKAPTLWEWASQFFPAPEGYGG